MKIFNILNTREIEFLKSQLKECSWSDGSSSAEGNAKKIKKNKEIRSNDPNFQIFINSLMTVFNNSNIKSYTFIKELINPMVSKYSIGDGYDWHVDVALLAGRRTDLSFTLFLSDYAEYDGGELEIEVNSKKIKIKPKSGDIVIYPSGLLHKVHEVTKGERIVIIGWLTSHVKIEEHRQRLYELAIELTKLREVFKINSPELDRLYYQLIRDYSN